MLLSFDCFLVILFLSKCQADVTRRPLENLGDKALNFTETVAQDGYNAEEHQVTTEDGYILTLHRILPNPNCTKKRPVLFGHALFQASEGYIDAGSESPGYVFSQNCYDVWLGNFRGNYYSRKHVFLNPDKDLKFWQFDLEQLGKYDIPAFIDYVLQKTNSKKLIYLGYSQGAATFFILNSERPEYAGKVSLFIALSPGTQLINTKSVQTRALANLILKFRTTLEAIGIRELLPRGRPIATLINTLCTLDPLGIACNLVSFVVDTPHPDSITVDIEKRLYRHAPAGSSVQTAAYYGQLLNSKGFPKFDFGPELNLKTYGTSQPPEYNLKANQVPTILFHGPADSVVDTKDTVWIVNQLPNLLNYTEVADPQWNHLDMSYSRYWKKTIFESFQGYLPDYSYDDVDDL